MIEEEKDGYDESRHYRSEDPLQIKVPELNEERWSIRTGRSESCADLQRLPVQCSKLADVRQPNEYDDTYRSSIFRKAHPYITMEQWLPVFRCGQEDGNKHRPNSTNDAVEESGER